MLIRSQEFDNASWPKSNSTVSANAGTSPDGTTTADRLIPNAVNAAHSVSQGMGTFSIGDVVTASVFVKQDTGWPFLRIALSATIFATGSAYYDLSTGTTSNVGAGSIAKITALKDGWYRCELTATCSTGGSAATIFYSYLTVGAAAVGDGVIGPLIFGAQAEVGAFATSYIPTTSATVTRSADVNSQSITTVNNAVEGSVVTAFVANASSTRTVLEIGDGTANERIYLQSIAGALTLKVVDGGVEQCSLSLGSVVSEAKYKVAFAWKANDFAASINGATAVTDTAGTLPTVTTLYQGQDYASANRLCSQISRTTLFTRRLANSTLQGLST